MEKIYVLCALLVISLIGGYLFYLASREIEVSFPWKVWCGAVFSSLIQTGMFIYYYHETGIQMLKMVFLLAVLWVCAWTDIKKYLILNKVLLVALLLRSVWLGMEFVIYPIEEFQYQVVAALIAAAMLGGSAMLCKLVSAEAVGYGDIKLLMVLGLYAGTNFAINILMYSFFILFVVVIVLLLLRKVNRKSQLPFAVFLMVGTMAASVLTGI